MKILAIESSCDETAAAVIEGKPARNASRNDAGGGDKVTVLSNVVASQIEIHQKYGGVVPEVAAREHVLNIIPVINEALLKAGIKTQNLKVKNQKLTGLDAIAVTAGPGLVTSLTVGVETAKSLAYAWKLPLIAVNHIAGHIYANWIFDQETKSKEQRANIKFPAVIMTVSGGHNMLILMKNHLDYQVIGDTLDDAAGEAFDKGAKMLDLGYPGGPIISQKAAEFIDSSQNFQFPISNFQTNPKSKNPISKNRHSREGGNPRYVSLPRPMLNSANFNFSFSGLKTALLYTLKKDKAWKKHIPEYAHEYQQAIVETLIYKTIKAAKKYDARTVLLAGGVSANKALREQMANAVTHKLPGVAFGLPDLKYTTDNAAMIGSAAYFLAREKKFSKWADIKANPNLELN